MNVQQGDIAVLLTCPDFPENIGMIVDVHEAVGACLSTRDAPGWRCVSQGRPFRGCNGLWLLDDQEAAVPDAWMMPVSGLADEDVVEREEPVEAVA